MRRPVKIMSDIDLMDAASARFSIITPCFNSSGYLRETIESVLSQDYPAIEYIIVDGGSTDGTVEIIREYAEMDSRICWISELDSGISDAFNKGISMASGDIIGILNSDDRYAPETLRTVAAAVAEYPECDVFHGNMLRYQGDAPLFLLKPSDVERNIWHEMPLNHPATFVTQKAYRQVGPFDTGLKIAMDYDMMLRLHKAGFCFCYIDEILANMRYGGASDAGVLSGLVEVFRVSVRQGYPRWKASCWMIRNGLLRTVKNIIRGMGLHFLLRIHPKFHSISKGGRL